MDKNNIRNSAELFLYKAEVDFNTAKYLLDGFNDGKLEIDLEKIYFESQQCAEKLLKAILSTNDTAFPRTHDLEDIIELCRKNDIELIDNVDRLTDLTEYAVQGRYAIIHDDLEDADEYIILLEKLLSYAKQQIL
mgnify:CR=1 FL=1